MKTIRIGVASQEEIRKRTMDIVSGRIKPKPSDPKIWFTSIKSVGAILNEENRELLKLMLETKPDSVGVLAEMTGRTPGNLSRTLNTMSKYGLVELKKSGRKVTPIAKSARFEILAA